MHNVLFKIVWAMHNAHYPHFGVLGVLGGRVSFRGGAWRQGFIIRRGAWRQGFITGGGGFILATGHIFLWGRKGGEGLLWQCFIKGGLRTW